MDVLAAHAARHPDKPALLEGERAWSWGELVARRNRLGHGLIGLGLPPGGHVIVYAENSLEHYLAGAAARAAGLIPAPMNHRLVAEEAALHPRPLRRGRGARERSLPAHGGAPSAPRPRKVRQWILLGSERRPWGVHVDDLLAAGRPDPVEPRGGEGFGGSMIYTGGTTGKPKGALRRGINPQDLMDTLRAMDLLDPAHVHLVAGPLYHSAPGGFALYTTSGRRHRGHHAEVRSGAGAGRRSSATGAPARSWRPTLLKRIVDLPAAVRARYDVSSMRAIVMAAAPCPMSVKEEVVAHFGPVLYEFYGSTELGVNTVLRPGGRAAQAGLLRARGAGQGDRAARRRRPAGADRAAGRALRAPVPRHPRRVLQESGTRPRRCAAATGYTVGDVAYVDADGFVLHLRPQARHDHLGRRQHLPGRDRGRAAPPSRRCSTPPSSGCPTTSGASACTPPSTCVPARPSPPRAVTALLPRSTWPTTRCRARSPSTTIFPRDAAGKLLKRQLREPYWAGRASRV